MLPFTFSVRQADGLTPYEYELPPYRVRIYPPCRAAVNPADLEAVSPVPAFQVIEHIRPADKQEVITSILMDGAPTVQANLLQIDFLKPDFDRRRPESTAPEVLEAHGDPSIVLAFKAANDVLGRVRTITEGTELRSVSPRTDFWRLDYLTDDEKELSADPKLFRRRMGMPYSWRICGINPAVWEALQALPADFQPPAWHTLLLDAEALLPRVGASIVLAYAALETLIEACLNQLAPLSNVPTPLWKWITERHGDDRLTPSVSEQFNELLLSLTGKSLKNENKLWEMLQNLRSARNSFLHEGRAVVGGKQVTADYARALVAGAKGIANWVEVLLPPELRRPKLEKTTEFMLEKMLSAQPKAAGSPAP